jgi:hypothetical protein
MGLKWIMKTNVLDMINPNWLLPTIINCVLLKKLKCSLKPSPMPSVSWEVWLNRRETLAQFLLIWTPLLFASDRRKRVIKILKFNLSSLTRSKNNWSKRLSMCKNCFQKRKKSVKVYRTNLNEWPVFVAIKLKNSSERRITMRSPIYEE